MTIRQRLLKSFYPLLMRLNKDRKGKILYNEKHSYPAEPFYNLSVKMNDGKLLSFKTLKGKKVLLVNTASDCGYTAQLKELQQLYERYHDRLQIIGFPANDFGEQEKGSNNDISTFCRANYGVQFPLADKSVVKRSAIQNAPFKWLTNRLANGWNDHAPDWNFSKYLVNEEGILTHYFGPAVSPLSAAVRKAIERS